MTSSLNVAFGNYKCVVFFKLTICVCFASWLAEFNYYHCNYRRHLYGNITVSIAVSEHCNHCEVKENLDLSILMKLRQKKKTIQCMAKDIHNVSIT